MSYATMAADTNMQTAKLFEIAKLSIQAKAIARNGVEWLARMQPMVCAWAAEAGLEIQHALSADLGELPLTPPTNRIDVDAVVPFCTADAAYLVECLQSLAAQKHVNVTLHVISDGARWPRLSDVGSADLRRYETSGGCGPYRITNAVFRFCKSRYLAIQDADDTCDSNRLWRQLALLQQFGADMISSAMETYIQTNDPDEDGELARRLAWEPICRPGRRFVSNPRGRCVNSMRMMTAELFQRINGFGDLFCSGDFEFDNRARFGGVAIVDDQAVIGRRRLHSASLTGGTYRRGSPGRVLSSGQCMESMRTMEAIPTFQTATRLGALHKADSVELREVTP